ncbi:CRE-STR-90 protein [Aphelenchoides avenae]|nr:CRE-STR-90 protein [Aphelenchus avenae]
MFHPLPDFHEHGIRVLELSRWPSNGADRILFGSNIHEWRLRSWIPAWGVTSTVIIIAVAICEKQIMRYFKLAKESHRNTRQMHSEFHRALMAMAIVPLVTSTVPTVYFLIMGFFELTTGPYAAFVGTAVSSITLFNPLTTIFFMRCYRDVVLKAIPCLKKGQVVDVATTCTSRLTGLEESTRFSQPTVNER